MKKNDNPRISIIYPVYNVAEYLGKSIESCLLQTFYDFEIIAINDGSTDSSYDILCKYAEQDARVKIVNQPNQGVATARMIGLSISLGEYITFVDSDDILPIDALEVLYSIICLPDVDIAIGDYLELMNGKYMKTNSFSKNVTINALQYIDLILNQKIQWGLCAKLYKRTLFENIVPIPAFKLGEDAALLIQIINNAKQISLVDKCVYHYVQRMTSAVHVKSAPYLVDIYNFRIWIASLLREEKYYNESLLRKFLVAGYIECVFLGGNKTLSKIDYFDILPFYNEVKKELFFWHRVVFSTLNIPVIGSVVIKSLSIARNLKLRFLHKLFF